MTVRKFTKVTTVVDKNSMEAKVVFTGGFKVRYLALPVDETGKVALDSTSISLQGCFESGPFFTINDFSGVPLQLPTRVSQLVAHVPNGLNAHPAVLPLRFPELTEGVQAIILILNSIETEQRQIDIYFEPNP